MKHPIAIGLAAGAILLLTGIGYTVLRHRSGPVNGQPPASAGEAEGPVAHVRTVALKNGAIDKTILVYGNVIPAPGAQTTISVPFESRIKRVMVNEGQEVSQGDPLLELGPSPDTHMKLKQAEEAYDVAAQALKNMERKFQLRLATNDQLLQARQTLEQARLTVDSMKNQGIDGQRELRANVEGLVSKVSVDEGALAPAGAPLLQLVPRNRLEIRLGAEPEDINTIHEGMPVSLSRASEQTAGVSGRVRKVSRSVNPSTRLVDVFVSVPFPATFLLGQYISGRIVVGSVEGIVVPRNVVLPEEGNFVVFVVKDGRAVKKTVRLLAENAREAVVEGEGLRPGDEAVTVGNYELKDNMRILGEPAR
jgi:membrane fusion protein, multidrug efflux system